MNSAMTLRRNRMRLSGRMSSGLLLTACIAVGPASQAQEPSPSLKQADADYRAGTAALTRNDLKTALTEFQSVVRLAPSAEQGHSALGAVLVRMGRVSEGTRELEKALAMKPGDSSAQLNLALAYQQSDEAAKALPLFARLEVEARAEKRPLALSILIPSPRLWLRIQILPWRIYISDLRARRNSSRALLVSWPGLINCLQITHLSPLSTVRSSPVLAMTRKPFRCWNTQSRVIRIPLRLPINWVWRCSAQIGWTNPSLFCKGPPRRSRRTPKC